MLIRRGPNPEGSYINQLRGVPIRKGLDFAIRKGPICANSEGYYFIKDLGRRKKDCKVRGIRLLTHRLGISDCTGNLPFNKNQTNTRQVRTRIFATLSLN